MVFKKDLIKFKKINVRSLPERLREFYINFSFRQSVLGYARPIREPNIFLVAQVIIIDIFFFFLSFLLLLLLFFFDRTLCHRNCHILSLCRYVVGSGYYND